MLLYCQSTVASAVDWKVHTAVASRGIIRVTVTIGACQARVSSSSEGVFDFAGNSQGGNLLTLIIELIDHS